MPTKKPAPAGGDDDDDEDHDEGLAMASAMGYGLRYAGGAEHGRTEEVRGVGGEFLLKKRKMGDERCFGLVVRRRRRRR